MLHMEALAINNMLGCSCLVGCDKNTVSCGTAQQPSCWQQRATARLLYHTTDLLLP
jgi:hypothetical protein